MDGGYYGPQGFQEMRGDTVGAAKSLARRVTRRRPLGFGISVSNGPV